MAGEQKKETERAELTVGYLADLLLTTDERRSLKIDASSVMGLSSYASFAMEWTDLAT